MNVAQTTKDLIFSVLPVTDTEALDTLRGLKGRGVGGYAARFRDWLESNSDAYMESISAEYLDHPNDRGVDVLLTGHQSKAKVGFQIKSDRDVAAGDFTVRTKAQLTDAFSWHLECLFVILACRPTEKNQSKYLYVQNEAERWGKDDVVVISPNRAAGLLSVFDRPISVRRKRAKTWSDLFSSLDKENLVSLYLDPWPGLAPDTRFVAPLEYKQILESVHKHPMTILTGPPGVGKTFIALQLLWDAFTAGRHVIWIRPLGFDVAEGPVASGVSPLGFAQRVAFLARSIGLSSGKPPLDAIEFVAVNLQPNSLVYIEDPFGKIDREFNESLHTYNFLELNELVRAIDERSARSNCKVVITSREGVFDQWLEKRKQLPAGAKTLQITKDSYTRDQRWELIRKLSENRGWGNAEEVADTLADRVETPFEAELLLRDLSGRSSTDEIEGAVKKARSLMRGRLEKASNPRDDSDRLFILLLVANDLYGKGRSNFFWDYCVLHRAMSHTSDPEESLARSIAYYRLYVSKYASYGFGRREPGYRLDPVHSTVVEALTELIASAESSWYESLSESLTSVDSGYRETFLAKQVATTLLKWGGERLSQEARTNLFDVLLNGYGPGAFNTPYVAMSWNSLSTADKERLRIYYQGCPEKDLAEFCACLGFSGFLESDAWYFLELLATAPDMGAGYLFLGRQWAYLGARLSSIPATLERELSKRAAQSTELFTYSMAELLISHWHEVVEDWRAAFFSEKSVSNPGVQGIVLALIARDWGEVPEDLQAHFLRQANSDIAEIRSNVISSALCFYDRSPKVFKTLLTSGVRDRDILVPLKAFAEGVGDERHVDEYAQTLLARADEASAAYMLDVLVEREIPKIGWKKELCQRCLEKGGELSRAVLAFNRRKENLKDGRQRYPRSRIHGESDPVKLAWVCVYANDESGRRGFSARQVIDIVESLSDTYKLPALLHVSIQFNFLPRPLRLYIEQLGMKSGVYTEQIKKGVPRRAKRNAKSRSIPQFPVHLFIGRNAAA